jgi:uncharacterized protein YecT (DUF1311 family)
MKIAFLAPLAVLVLAHASPANALDCAKAVLAVDKLICATPDLKKADEEMGTAYFKLLHETTDPDFHEALIKSQRRWLKVRSLGPERFGLAENDKTDDRDVLLKMTRDRLTFLQTAKPIQVMEQERKIMSEDGGGAFAGFQIGCSLQPPPYGFWTYECLGNAHRQHNGRICSSVSEWATHIMEYRLVSVLGNGKPNPVAICATLDSGANPHCPEPDDNGQTRALWNTAPDAQSTDFPLPTWRAGDLWKYDPDIDLNVIDQQWMHDCLFSPNYPPPEMSHPNE